MRGSPEGPRVRSTEVAHRIDIPVLLYSNHGNTGANLE